MNSHKLNVNVDFFFVVIFKYLFIPITFLTDHVNVNLNDFLIPFIKWRVRFLMKPFSDQE